MTYSKAPGKENRGEFPYIVAFPARSSRSAAAKILRANVSICANAAVSLETNSLLCRSPFFSYFSKSD
jgi:hypothetical protein